mmetsp:Transcript_11127/g.24798  ORF Transcript_11127/g.24798 Transcript_11127/m.24798 type:complete len:94 (-) Transcript_11127:126-407(-)
MQNYHGNPPFLRWGGRCAVGATTVVLSQPSSSSSSSVVVVGKTPRTVAATAVPQQRKPRSKSNRDRPDDLSVTRLVGPWNLTRTCAALFFPSN